MTINPENILAKAWSDEAFKQALLANPHKAIQDEFGTAIPDSPKLHVVESTSEHLYVIIPAPPAGVENQSTEELLAQLNEQGGQDAQAKLVVKVWKDEAFKQSLIQSPQETLTQELGAKLPGNLTVEVLVEDEQNSYLVIPVKPTLSDDELSDQELEAVAGGADLATTIMISIVTIGVGNWIAGR